MGRITACLWVACILDHAEDEQVGIGVLRLHACRGQKQHDETEIPQRIQTPHFSD